MSVYRLDPLTDPRWRKFLEEHRSASVFHTPGWLEALRITYGYRPVVYTTTQPGRDLENGIPLCRVDSWLTGRRLVSVPFSDHCQPLVDSVDDMQELMAEIARDVEAGRLKYAELRPVRSIPGEVLESAGYAIADRYLLYDVDVTVDLDEMYAAFHRSSVRQKIQRAEREGLTYECGLSDKLLGKFYHLLMTTRRKHGLPPQPITWFRNLMKCLGDAMMIRVSSSDGIPTAAKIALTYKGTYCAKYQSADYSYSRLGGTQLLSWYAIKDAKERGALVYDMGRCGPDDEGLRASKEAWAPNATEIQYVRYPASSVGGAAGAGLGVAKEVFSRLPDFAMAFAGRMLYKHMG